MSFQGKLNIYTCDKCFRHIVTVDLVTGTTPFILGCRATVSCTGSMESSMYRVWDQRMRPDFEWYKPVFSDSLAPAVREHVEKGGLMLRPCDEEALWDGNSRKGLRP